MSEKQHPNKGIGSVGVAEKAFSWVIDDLVINLSKSKLVSPKFPHKVVGNTTSKWFIELLQATLAENKQCMGISVGCTHHSDPNRIIDITILDDCNVEIFRYARSDMDLTIFNPRFFCFVPMDKLRNEKVSSNGNNQITLVVSFVEKEYFKMKMQKTCADRSRINCLNSFAKIVDNKQFSDVILDVGGEELYAYKGILASRSPVFMAMFSNDMIETNCSRVKIDDISYKTMTDLLQYIYTDIVPKFECEEDQEKCKNLLIAANKYGLAKLKFKMEEKLALDIQVCNLFEYLNFSDVHNADHLKEKAIEFIISHKNEIAESENYKKFSDLHPNVSCEVFHSLLVKRRKLD